ncbi:hypothetical protein [Hydrogenophaga sp.]|uniref:hypothetical protein n=1 Tax=Hydrogenophaga sp. TaxID=1904254 RepID=UPI003568BAA7
MFFNLSWFKPKPASYHDTQVLELDFLVDEFHEAMVDIQDPMRLRIQAALLSCQSPKDLWFLRGKVFNLISKHHCESEAKTRVNKLDQKLRFFVSHHPDHEPQDLPSGPMALMH